MISGSPAQIARNFAKLEPGHVQVFEPLAVGVALVYCLAWVWILLDARRSPARGLLYWATGASLLWGLAATLWLSWIDYGKTYAPVAASLRAALEKTFPSRLPCVQSLALGESQRGAFDYHAEIVTRAHRAETTLECPALLVQARPDEADPNLGDAWKRVWEGNRPRDRERYRLYVRVE
jgi:4-amino-4-deoxy-L-arabinose transferase-like glycosyltransferase